VTGCLLYYITNRLAFGDDEHRRRRHLLEKIGEAARAGVDYIQLREKDLPARELEALARDAVRTIHENSKTSTVLLINSRIDVALAANAGGVHLPADDLSPKTVKEAYSRAGGGLGSEIAPQISVSCHSPDEVNQAAVDGATVALFAPVFEKIDARGRVPQGLASLRQACEAKIPVLALGGVTLQNAQSCLSAGAAGIAGIRLFQENEIAVLVRAMQR
jgi:thiamine-phosphate pyrophosphorylase